MADEEIKKEEAEIPQQEENVTASDSSDESTEKTEQKFYSEDELASKLEEERDRTAKKMRDIAERRARQKYDREAAQPAVSDTPPGQKWNELVGWIPAETTADQLTQMIANSLGQGNQNGQGYNDTASTMDVNANYNQSSNSQPVAPGQSMSNSSNGSSPLTPESLRQIDNCLLRYDDGEAVIGSSAITDIMANVAATDPHGVDNLYRFQKENPQKLFEISRKSPYEQAACIVAYNQEMTSRRQKKVKSNAIPQPTPLDENGGSVIKKYNELSFAEKKAIRRKEGYSV